MFGSTPNPFGQSSSSPFGSPSGFGQTSNASNNNIFAPKPFGSTATTPFGAQTGTSLFGGTSTGVFGTATQSPSPFGASSSPAFGSSTPAFGATSTPAFGNSSSPFGGSSVFGQKPTFGAFGSTPAQPSPFGSTAQPSQPAFGNSLFGSSTPFGAQSQPAAFGAPSQPAFGASTTPAFGASTTPAFGASTTPAFGSTTSQPFGTGGTAGSPLFGSGGAFGTTTTSAFGASTTPAFGASTTPAFSFSSSPAFGQSASAFASNPFGSSTTSPFGAQSSMFGAQTTTPAFGSTGFGQSTFGAQRGGSRVAPYTPTTEPDNSSSGAPGKLESISAMTVYKDKSHEELRWEDHQLGDKGGPMPASQPSGLNFNTPAVQPSVLGPSPTFNQSSSSLFSNSNTSSIFAPKPSNPTPNFSSGGFGSSLNTSPGLFSQSSSSLFSTNTTPSLFPSSAPSFAPSTFSPQVPASTPGFNTSIFPNVTPAGQTGSGFGQATSTFGPTTTPPFTQSNLFTSPSTGFANSFLNTPSLAQTNPMAFNPTTPAFPGSYAAPQPAQQTNNSFALFPQLQPANPGGAATGMFGSLTTTLSPAVVQPVPATNPFGTLPAMPQMSIGRGGITPSIQYGISSMPVPEKAAPVRISSFLTSRHLSQRRIRLPARKYNPKTDGTKVPFFSDDDETASTPKADALFLPRENPRALVIRPADSWSLKSSASKASPIKETSPLHENVKFTEESRPTLNGFHSEGKEKDHVDLKEKEKEKEKGNSVKTTQKANGVDDDHDLQKEGSYMTLSGHRAGEAAIVYEHGAGIEALMPKLRRSNYYTEPRIQELAAKERAEPGFCQHVKNFVVGRVGYGSIKFLGETDVRRLDLETLVQFNNREVIVYMDDTKKPPVGQGLNKPAEVTLLNIKCFDKKTGRHYTDGPKIDKYIEMLNRKAKDQGAEFVSYDPVNGEWKFRVDHFSAYKLTEEDEQGFDG